MRKVETGILLWGIWLNFMYLREHGVLRFVYILGAVAFWMAANGIHLIVHEAGHLTGGWISGYRPVVFSAASLRIIWPKTGKPKLCFVKDHGGQCVMEPRNPENCPYLIYNLGGMAANLMVALAAWLLPAEDSLWLGLLTINLVWVGIQKIILNAIPVMVGGYPTDGCVVKLLMGKDAVRKDYGMYLSLYAAWFRGETVDHQRYRYTRDLDAAEAELLYYREIRKILKKTEDAAAV